MENNTPETILIDFSTRLAIFMQYHNCQFEAITHTTYVGPCYGFWLGETQAIALPSILNPSINLHRVKVLLKPLGEISQEEKYIAAAYQGFKNTNDFTCSFKDQQYNNDKVFGLAWDNGYEFGHVKLNDLNYRTVDYLRSRGYAMPYGPYSVEQLTEAGIYKLTDK